MGAAVVSKKVSFYKGLKGREEVWLDLLVDPQGKIQKSSLRGIGGSQFLNQLDHWRDKIKGSLSEIHLPQESDTASLILRELLLRAKEQWQPPYSEAQICHCRAIATQIVDDAILVGAHTTQEVSRMTSASTACGTCQPDVKALIEYRLGKSSAKKQVA